MTGRVDPRKGDVQLCGPPNQGRSLGKLRTILGGYAELMEKSAVKENSRNASMFLWEFREEPGIFYGRKNKFRQGRSIGSLLELMNKHGVSRLEDPGTGWFLESNYAYCNPAISIEGDNLYALDKIGDVFRTQNSKGGINPFYNQSPGEQAEADLSYTRSARPKFNKESELQQALRHSIEQLEPGLRVIDGGKERRVEAGSIDITAEDDSGNLVIIELKDGVAGNGDLTQMKVVYE